MVGLNNIFLKQLLGQKVFSIQLTQLGGTQTGFQQVNWIQTNKYSQAHPQTGEYKSTE